MEPREALVSVMPRLQAVDLRTATRRWRVSLERRILHSRKLWVDATPDQDSFAKLVSVGFFDLDNLLQLDTMAQAASHAQAEWLLFASPELVPSLRSKLNRCEAVRGELLLDFDYIAERYDPPNLRNGLRKVRMGTDRPDLMQDLVSLNGYSVTYRDYLAKIDFDFKKAEEALALNNELGPLFNATDADRASALTTRDRARFLLETMNAEVRAAGRFIHRHNPERAAVYADLPTLRRRGSDGDGEAEPVGEGEPLLGEGEGEGEQV